MYNNSLGLLHLSWVLLSFINPINTTLFFSLILMLPIYFAEFVMVYGSRVPLIKDYKLFKTIDV